MGILVAAVEQSALVYLGNSKLSLGVGSIASQLGGHEYSRCMEIVSKMTHFPTGCINVRYPANKALTQESSAYPLEWSPSHR